MSIPLFNSMFPVDGESEGDYVNRLIKEIVKATDFLQTKFKVEYEFDFHRKYPGIGGVGLRYSTFQAVRDHEPTSLTSAIRIIISAEVINEARTRFGDSAVSLSFLVNKGARMILDSRKPPKKKKEEERVILPEPLSDRVLRKVQMRADILDSEPVHVEDLELGVTFENALERTEFKTVAEVRQLARDLLASEAIREELASEFLGPPEPATAQFPFALKMPRDRGEKVFVQPRWSRLQRKRFCKAL